MRAVGANTHLMEKTAIEGCHRWRPGARICTPKHQEERHWLRPRRLFVARFTQWRGTRREACLTNPPTRWNLQVPMRPWPSACGRARSTNSWARRDVVGEKSLLGIALSASWHQAAVAHPLGAAGHRQDDPRPLDRQSTWIEIHRALRGACRRARSSRRPSTRPGKARIATPARSSSSTRSIASTRPSKTPCLGAVEDGTVSLIGATTENPSFEVNAALLSRCRVVVLQPLEPGRRRHDHPPRARRPGTRPGAT